MVNLREKRAVTTRPRVAQRSRRRPGHRRLALPGAPPDPTVLGAWYTDGLPVVGSAGRSLRVRPHEILLRRGSLIPSTSGMF